MVLQFVGSRVLVAAMSGGAAINLISVADEIKLGREAQRQVRAETPTGDLAYQDPGADVYEARDRSRIIRRLRQRADNLGFALIDLKTGELAEGAVS